jgi:hypothetical protein
MSTIQHTEADICAALGEHLPNDLNQLIVDKLVMHHYKITINLKWPRKSVEVLVPKFDYIPNVGACQFWMSRLRDHRMLSIFCKDWKIEEMEGRMSLAADALPDLNNVHAETEVDDVFRCADRLGSGSIMILWCLFRKSMDNTPRPLTSGIVGQGRFTSHVPGDATQTRCMRFL